LEVRALSGRAAAKAGIRVIETGVGVELVDVAGGGAVRQRVDVADRVVVVAVAMMGLHAKIIRRKKAVIVRNRVAVKTTIFVNAKTARVMKTKMFQLRWMKRPKAKALPEWGRKNRTKRMNFTKNAPKPIASIPKHGSANANQNACVMIAGAIEIADVIVTQDMTGAGVIATAPVDEGTSGNVRVIERCAARSIGFGTAWKLCCAISNALSVRCNKPNRNAT